MKPLPTRQGGRLLAALSPRLYVQLSPERLTVRDVRSGQSLSDTPWLAIRHRDGRAHVAAMGRAAERLAHEPGVTIVNPFAHPRTIISDFTAAEQLLKAFIRQWRPRKLLQPAPWIVIHPLPMAEGGYTQVELRALRELALGAGAAGVDVWIGPALRDDQVRDRAFPPGGELAD